MTDTRIADAPVLGPGRALDLPGRGTVVVRDIGPHEAMPLVLLHGWTVTADLNWFGQYDALSNQHRVISFDHAGHGNGLRPRRRVSVKSLAADVIAVADALGLEQFVPVGYSLGGAVAQVLARDHRPRLAGLVLSATTPRFRASDLLIWPGILLGVAGLTRVSPDFVVDRVFANMVAKRTADLHPWGVEQLQSHDPRILLEVGASLFSFDATSYLADVSLPAAVVITEDDPKTRPQNQRRFADFIDGTTLHPVRGAHDAPVASPDTYNPGLLDAVDSVLSRHTG